MTRFLSFLLIAVTATQSQAATLFFGNDFQSGTTDMWFGNANPQNIPTGGPEGDGDRYLQIGEGMRFAIFNESDAYKGDFAAAGITAITVDLFAPSGNPTDYDMRIVLFGLGMNTGERWTSSDPQTVVGDGDWRSYTFSLAESDLTQVLGTASYSDLITDVNRIMLRHDPSPASATGVPAPGVMGIDNVMTIPEPAAGVLFAASMSGILLARRRRSQVR